MNRGDVASLQEDDACLAVLQYAAPATGVELLVAGRIRKGVEPALRGLLDKDDFLQDSLSRCSASWPSSSTEARARCCRGCRQSPSGRSTTGSRTQCGRSMSSAKTTLATLPI